MMLRRRIRSDQKGAATIEMAFAFPVFIVMVWMFVQLAQVYRALSGIQQALGEGARYATLCLSPTATGCTIPTAAQITDKINASVYGIGPGTFAITPPVLTADTANGGKYYDLTVTYTQPTTLLLFRGPNVSIARSKRVWVAT